MPADRSAFSLTLRVYWEDTDAGGVVYHASYVRFLERARTEWLRAAGYDQTTLRGENGLLLVVRLCAKCGVGLVVKTCTRLARKWARPRPINELLVPKMCFN